MSPFLMLVRQLTRDTSPEQKWDKKGGHSAFTESPIFNSPLEKALCPPFCEREDLGAAVGDGRESRYNESKSWW
jgi:hypothetical protein